MSAKSTDFMERARRRFREAADYERVRRDEAREDWRFYDNLQWNEELKREREEAGRPCLTVNRCKPFAKQVINQIRAARPQARISPAGDANEEDAEVRQGLTRHIEVDSDAEIAYDNAITGAVVGGFGAWRIISEYEYGSSTDQCLKIKRILDPFSVYWDPNSVEPDRSDAKFCFVRQRMTVEAYKDEFGEAAAQDNFAALGEDGADWNDDGKFIYIAEYFEVDEQEDGTRKIHWCLINGVRELEEYNWPGRWIPVIPCLGDEYIVDGQLVTAGIIREMRDPQRMFNFIKSSITERVGFATAAKWLAPIGSTEGQEIPWSQANKPGNPILYWKPTTDDRGNALGPPQPVSQESGIADLSTELLQTDQDLKTTTGLFDPSLGNSRPDQSGEAIKALQSQGNIANYAFGDNLTRSIRHSTRVILDAIPHYYDAGRVMMIDGLDGQKVSAFVYNSDTLPTEQIDPAMAQAVKGIYDLKKGQYTVTISTGPSFETQRQQDADFWMGLVKSFPELMTVAGDIIVSRLDSPEARAVSERLKAVLPPPIQNMLQGNQPPSPQQQQVQAQNQQMQGILQQLIQEKQAKILELQSKERIAARNNETQLIVADIAAKADSSQADLDMQIKQLQAVLGIQDSQHDRAHEAAMAAMQHAHSLEQAQHAQSFQADQSSKDQAFQAQQSQQAAEQQPNDAG
jgi:hypothetical protein